MLKILIIVGSTRPNRKGLGVAQWVLSQAAKRTDAKFELVDLAEINLPLLDEPIPPSSRQYQHQHTKDWSQIIDPADGFIIVTPEYNHGYPAALKNAIDFLWYEWNNKAVGFVSYGSNGGVRAVEQLRQVAAEVELADIRYHLTLGLRDDFADGKLQPKPHHAERLDKLLTQLLTWSAALKTIR